MIDLKALQIKIDGEITFDNRTKSVVDLIEYSNVIDRAIAAEAKLAEIEKKEPYLTIKNYEDELAEKFMPQEYKRIGDIHIGGDILPEFNSEKWCKDCGSPVEHVHLPNCPTLKSKL